MCRRKLMSRLLEHKLYICYCIIDFMEMFLHVTHTFTWSEESMFKEVSLFIIDSVIHQFPFQNKRLNRASYWENEVVKYTQFSDLDGRN
uniref:Uncharacterized protein n=1 Tax=Arundo donax TaxID=35708 RepID=A0A0A9D2G5_ARUDO